MKRTTFEDSEKEEKTIERPRLEWQQSTAVSSARASLMPALASSFRNILEDLGEDSSRPGLVDTPDRAAKALLFFTKGYEDRLVDLNTYLHKKPFKYYVSIFLAFLGPPTHLHQHKFL